MFCETLPASCFDHYFISNDQSKMLLLNKAPKPLNLIYLEQEKSVIYLMEL